ncbi:hypothetical protein BASA81_007876 [Batrachochytrium salamandrivorans]|nr:hypothetical protein BASA81_007876 [Batrachochytrium salamandrivorans]
MLLADCTRLTKVEMLYCKFSPPVAFTLPKSVTKLVLHDCAFVGGFDWSFLAGSKVRELNFHIVRAVGENQFGGALADHLRTKGLDKLQFYDCNFVDETLAVIGVEIGRIKRLILEGGRVSNASIELIAPCVAIPQQRVSWHISTKVAAKAVEVMFRNRLALFALLQGQQVKRRYCPLRRLPVEMLRVCHADRLKRRCSFGSKEHLQAPRRQPFGGGRVPETLEVLVSKSRSCRMVLDDVFEGLATGKGRFPGRKLPVCACDEEL